MTREVIGGVTGWEMSWETDWAYEMAMSFLKVALGDSPPGVTIEVVLSDNDYGPYPSIAVDWAEGVTDPWDFIHRAEKALAEFNDAIDWHRIRPSNFLPDDEAKDEDEDEMSEDRLPFWFGDASLAELGGAERYLRYLADCLCYALGRCDRDEKAYWWKWFRQFTDEIRIADVECSGTSFEDEVRAVLSPGNRSALDWSRACIERGLAREADPHDPDSVIGRLSWPAIPGFGARDD